MVIKMKSLKIVFFTVASIYSMLCFSETDSIEKMKDQVMVLYVEQIVSNYSNADKMIPDIRGLCRAR